MPCYVIIAIAGQTCKIKQSKGRTEMKIDVLRKTCTMDELGRVLIPGSMQKQLGWRPRQELTIHINRSMQSVEFFAQPGGMYKLDEHNRVKVDPGTRMGLGWGKADKFILDINESTSSITLTLDNRRVQCIYY